MQDPCQRGTTADALVVMETENAEQDMNEAGEFLLAEPIGEHFVFWNKTIRRN